MSAVGKAPQVIGVSAIFELTYSHPGGFEKKEEYEVQNKLKWSKLNAKDDEDVTEEIPTEIIENSPRFTNKTTLKKLNELEDTINTTQTAECDKKELYIFQEIIVVRVKSGDNSQYELRIPTDNIQTHGESILVDNDKFNYYKKKK